MPACHRHYPGRADGACSLVHPHRQRPSLCNSQVGSCNCCFGTCSAFTHVTACTLAESPSDPFHRKLRQLRRLGCRFDCYRVERTSSRAGVPPTEVQRLFTAHYYANNRRHHCFAGLETLPKYGCDDSKHPRRRLFAEEVADHPRRMLCRGSRDEYIVGWQCTSEACRLIAVAAWVRRLPSWASKSSVQTLYSQRIHLNCIPPSIRLVV